MRPIGENSSDFRDYGDYEEGCVSQQFNDFINYNYEDDEGIIEDRYLPVEYAIYFKQKHEYELKMKEERKKKDQELFSKVLGLLGL